MQYMSIMVFTYKHCGVPLPSRQIQTIVVSIICFSEITKNLK